MKKFFAYFDLLGYKAFILNNIENIPHLDEQANNYPRNIEMALAGDRPKLQSNRPGVLIPDISQSAINCLNFSDTVVFWTNGNTSQDFIDIIELCYRYNSFNVGMDFPSRGCLVYDMVWFKDMSRANNVCGRYMLNLIYGPALIAAHSKAEKTNWAGCVIDNSAIERANELGNLQNVIDEHAVLYDVPYRNAAPEREYAFRLAKGGPLSEEFIRNKTESIRGAFTSYKKGAIEGRIKEIFDDTIPFLNHH